MSGVMWVKLADVLKQQRKNIFGMPRIAPAHVACWMLSFSMHFNVEQKSVLQTVFIEQCRKKNSRLLSVPR